MPDTVVAAAARTPIGRAYKGSLIDVRPDDLLLQLVRGMFETVSRVDPSDLDEVLLGCSLAAGEQGGNLARVLAVLLGADAVPGCTVNRYCASSMQTTRMADQAIRAGDGHVYLSLGLESVSRVRQPGPDPLESERHPAFTPAADEGAWSDPRERGALPDVFVSMGQTAENVADLCGVTRQEMDEFALRSQQLTAERTRQGFWDAEIQAVVRPDGSVVGADDSPRPGTTMDALSALKPAFRPDGRVTAGNSCPLNDGAAALLLMSDVRARELGVRPLARVVSTACSALSPEIMGLGTVEAARRAMHAAGLSAEEIDLVEINEAFAAQAVPTYRQLGFPLEKVNVNGGAIALGHPFGMSGTRISGTLLNSLRTHGGRFGLQTMCVAGGQGMAMVVENLS
ncbi:acetyl-CoA C-acetyltransferase [Amycolatopsis echigonensis]|uniref:Acetyl-CoA C-acetyltransferase n=1 Tax=Amycolatopsis echigonensis TaxID=2576905 RepID=A0A8E1W1X4_9PSEU|nr:acetyl-CoA C-acetyltransferase [Amycolatopsis echigonensis]MBB2502356.1 acetyl-CoA C-acetyltransferase [Amycolatopsis echigonensis]